MSDTLHGALLNHLISATILGLLPVLLIGGVIGIAIRAFMGPDAGPLDRTVVMAFGFVGAAAGIMLGAAREPAVHVALPAILTLVSTFLAYIYAKDKPKQDDAQSKALKDMIANADKDVGNAVKDMLGQVRFIPFGIIALILAASAGSFFGSSMRSVAEYNDRKYAEYLLEFEKIQIPVNLEVFKRQLGLSEPAETKPASEAPGTTKPEAGR